MALILLARLHVVKDDESYIFTKGRPEIFYIFVNVTSETSIVSCVLRETVKYYIIEKHFASVL